MSTRGATGNVYGGGRYRVDGHRLDSPDFTNKFLAAAGLTGAAREPSSVPQTIPLEPPPHWQHNLPHSVDGQPGNTATDWDPRYIQPEAAQHHWRQIGNEPEGRSKCLEALRPTQHNSRPSEYPEARQNQSLITNTRHPPQTVEPGTGWLTYPVKGQARDQNDSFATEGWGAASSPISSCELALSQREHSSAIVPPLGTRSRGFALSTLPPIHQSFVPKSSGIQDTVLEAIRDQHLGSGPSGTGMPSRKKFVSGSGRAERYSPDLTAHRVPRPDRNYPGSLPPSLPSVNISDTGVGVPGSMSTGTKLEADIRNKIALKPRFHRTSDNKWYTLERDDDEALVHPSYLEPFISAWIGGTPRNVRVSLSREDGLEHWKCDVDTNTGLLLPPIDYPETMADHSQVDGELDWRRQNWTSTLLMQRRADMRRSPRFNSRSKPRIYTERDEPQQDPLLTDPKWFVEVIEPKYEKPEFNYYVPRIPCFLRPAEKYDMKAVRLIYNQEMQFGLQTLDSQPLTVEDFEAILSATENLGMPFIVAVRGSARDLGLTGGNLLYSAYRQIPTDNSDPQNQRRGEILGFAFLSVWEPGLAGNTGSSRATARINLFVHHEHRRKKIGFSLLDMLLTTVSDRFSSQSGYDFVDPDNSPVYKPPKNDERKYFHLYLAYMVRHKHLAEGNKKLEEEQKHYDDDLIWIRKMLEESFNFTEKVRFEAVHRTPKCRDGPVGWLDAVVFEHTCQFDPRFIGDY